MKKTVALVFVLSIGGWGGTLFSDLAVPLPPNLNSLDYQSTLTREFGELVQVGPGNNLYALTSATVIVSDQALEADWPSYVVTVNGVDGFVHNFTMNVYNPGVGVLPGSLVATRAVSAFVPFRPPAGGGCGGGYLASDGHCYSGSLSPVTFDLSGVVVGGQFIVSLAYNTPGSGYAPLGGTGPSSKVFAAVAAPPTVGSNPQPDVAYWNTLSAGLYTDGGQSGSGIFRADTGWNGKQLALSVDGALTPEPGSAVLIGLGLLVVAQRLRRRS